jgi:hypothetical protein
VAVEDLLRIKRDCGGAHSSPGGSPERPQGLASSQGRHWEHQDGSRGLAANETRPSRRPWRRPIRAEEGRRSLLGVWRRLRVSTRSITTVPRPEDGSERHSPRGPNRRSGAREGPRSPEMASVRSSGPLACQSALGDLGRARKPVFVRQLGPWRSKWRLRVGLGAGAGGSFVDWLADVPTVVRSTTVAASQVGGSGRRREAAQRP